MVSETIKVNLAADAEARPVAVLVQKASQYESRVYIQAGDKKINAKSIMGMMSLQLGNGEELTVVADGEDEEDAIQGVENFLASTN